MKIAFDENVPMGMVRVFQALARERQLRRHLGGDFDVVSALDYAPKPRDRDYLRGSDVPWLRRFAADGGRIVISGDIRMQDNAFERAALIQNGFVTIFFERSWSEWNFFRKSALLLRWWPEITKKIKSTKRGGFWCVPSAWGEGDLRYIEAIPQSVSKSPPTRLDQTKRGVEPAAKRRSPSRRPRENGRQGSFKLSKSEKNDRNNGPGS